MLKLKRPPLRSYQTFTYDSRRWARYTPRIGDIFIATYVKSGTTWMQRIVGMLVFQSERPFSVEDMSPWPDRRTLEPAATIFVKAEGQTHRRFFKTHIPIDGLPLYDEVKYVHVVRDGRDVVMSWCDQHANFRDVHLARLDVAGISDPDIDRPFPDFLDNRDAYFHRWLTEATMAGDADGLPHYSWFEGERAWWKARHLSNVLLVHYRDLKADPAMEIARIADFLDVTLPADLLSRIVAASDFDAMRDQATALLGEEDQSLQNTRRFFNKGRNERWRGVFSEANLQLFEDKLDALGDDELAAFICHGRLRRNAGATS